MAFQTTSAVHSTVDWALCFAMPFSNWQVSDFERDLGKICQPLPERLFNSTLSLQK